MRAILAATAFGLAGMGFHCEEANAAEIKVLASNALGAVLGELIPMFERATGNKVVGVYDPTNAILACLKEGETADVVILIKQPIEDLESAGKIAANSKVDLAKTSLGIAVRSGSPKPDISTPEAFKQAMLNAKSVARTEVGASGIHFGHVLEELGIAQAMEPKLKVVRGSARTADLVAKGEAEVAVQMMSELLPVAGVDIVGVLPNPFAYEIVLTAGLSSSAKQPDAAKALIAFLKGGEASPIYKKKGMEPIRPC